MSFVERLFGWSPDGGDGSVETLLLLAAVVALAAAVAWRRLPIRGAGLSASRR